VTAGRFRGDAGQVAGIEAVPFGLLVLTIGVLVVAHTWAVVDAKFVATAAAREATRAYVEAPSSALARARAADAARAVVERSGRDPGALGLIPSTSSFGRCVPAGHDVALEVPAVAVPWRRERPAVVVHADHVEVVDPYRDGLPGLAACSIAP